jgi:DNA repair photolyase
MASVTHHQARSILSSASGFIGMFDYTLNPYSGCRFGCSYCYAAFFARTKEKQDTWGRWLEVKANALDLLKKKRKRPLMNQAIYMSSVTDPYQPIEGELELTRAILEELITYHQVGLVIQTRGTLVTRDIDLLKQFRHVQVNMTITTDDETVRKAFEPTCPPNPHRLDAIQQIHKAGIPTAITLAPLLPVQDAVSFAETLAQTGVPRFAVQYFHTTRNRFIAGTGEEARRLSHEMDWTPQRYQAVVDVLRARLPDVREAQAEFVPYWMRD